MASTDELRLAAYLGDLEAMQRLGDECPPVPEAFRSWVWGLGEWGKSALVTASCAVTRAALPVWETYVDPDERLGGIFGQPWVHQALAAAEAWLATPDEECLSKARTAVSAARTHSEAVILNVEEASGSAEVCRARERALAAALASYNAAASAAWTPGDVLNSVPGDVAEIEARRKAGPALEAVNAACFARQALLCSEQDLKRIIRGVLHCRPYAPQ
jgi:hypothetical protein